MNKSKRISNKHSNNVIKLSELSLAGAALASLTLNANTQKRVKAAGVPTPTETKTDRTQLNTNALTRMMNNNAAMPVQNSVDKATNAVNQLDTLNNADSNPTVTVNADNGGFDSSWGKLDVKDWKGHVDGDYYELDSYSGDPSHIIIPNAADFKKAGVDIQGKQVAIRSLIMHRVLVPLFNGTDKNASVAFSKTDNQKVKALETDWSDAFAKGTFTDQYHFNGRYGDGIHNNLTKFDGTSLDTSNITNMIAMFADDSLTDISSIKNWNTSNVTDMNHMFMSNYLTNVNALQNWDTHNVTNMEDILGFNKITNISALSNWNTSNVTNMSNLLVENQLTDIAPLQNWDTHNVTNMEWILGYNQISDLTPIKNWNTSKVSTLYAAFDQNNISDLTPLQNWDVSNVTNMSNMINNNKIQTLHGLENWKVDKVTTMSYMFDNNQISDISAVKDWNTSNVTNMEDMFSNNQIINLAPIQNWNVSNVTNMMSTFSHNNITDLTPLQNWNPTKVVFLVQTFAGNKITDLTPLKDWQMPNVRAFTNAFMSNPIKKADFSKWNFSKVLPSIRFSTLAKPLSGMQGFINSTVQHAIINMGDNTTLPDWFMNKTVTHRNNTNIPNHNIFTASYGGNVIYTTNQKLLDNPNDDFNYTTFNIGDTTKKVSTPVFIDSSNASESNNLNSLAEQLRQKTLTNFQKDYPSNSYLYDGPNSAIILDTKGAPVPEEYNNQDPVDMMNAVYNVNQKSLKVQFKNPNTDKVLDSYTQTININKDNSDKIDYSKVDATIDQLKQNGYNTDVITQNSPESLIPTWSSITNQGIGSNPGFHIENNNGAVTLTYDVSSSQVKVTHDQPKSTSDVIDGTIKHYPVGVDKDDLNKTLTRTIVFKDENGKTLKDPVTQTVHMYRDATIDVVTGSIKYTNWKVDGSFDAVNIPSVDGYTPDKTSIDKIESPKDGQNYNQAVIYTRNSEDSSITYVDDTTGKVLNTDTANPKYGDQIKFNNDPTEFINQLKSKGYDLVSNDYKDDSTASTDPTRNKFTVHVKERVVDVKHDVPKTPDDTIDGTTQKFPAGVAENDLNKTITRTVDFKDADGNEVSKPVTQTVHATRDAQVNVVTGKVVYTDWTTDGSFSAVDVPSKEGFTPDRTSVPKVDLPQVGQNYDTVIVYNDDDENAVINYIDENQRKVIKSDTASIKYGKEIKFATNPDDYIKSLEERGYEVDSNNFKKGVTASTDPNKNTFTVRLKQRMIVVKHDAPKTPDDVIEGTKQHYPKGVGQDDLNGTHMTRTINFVDEDGKTMHDTVVQKDPSWRDATVNAVTGQVIYGTWGNNGLSVYEPPKFEGYTYRISKNTGTDKDLKYTVTYLRITVPSSIKYVDDTTGETIKTDTATPKYNDPVKFDTDPTDYIKQLQDQGYDVVSNNFKDPITSLDQTKNVFEVHVKQGTTKVTSDSPKSTDDTIDGTTKKYPKGVSKDDLNKTITRTIVFKDENGKNIKDPVTQTVHAHRDATINKVTGQVTYTDWTIDGGLDGIDVPKVDGYTPDKTSIDKIEKPELDKDYNTSVIYSRNTEDSSITYVDDTTGKVIKTDTTSPKYGDKFNFETNPSDYIKRLKDKGYDVVSNDYTTDKTAKSDPTQNKFTVHVKQRTTQVTHNAPKSTDDVVDNTTQHYPKGVGQDDLNKTVTRTVVLEDENGKDLHDPIKQTVHMHRDATVNVVTGDVQYTPWTAESSFDSVDVPKIKGYTPDKASIAKIDTPKDGQDYNTTVTYTRNDETATITFVDDTTGKTIKTDTSTTKYGDEIKFKTNPSDYVDQLKKQGYEVISNNFKDGSTVNADTADNQYTVHVKQRIVKVTHDTPKTTDDTVDGSTQKYPKGVDTSDLNKDITRTIKIVDENGKELKEPITQTVHAHRDATINAVTGEVKYSDWVVDGNLDSVKLPDVTGYTPDKTSMPAVPEPEVGKDYNTSVVYTHNKVNVSISYVDDTTGKVINTETVKPKYGDTIKFDVTPSDYIKQLELQGYVLVSNSFKDNATVSNDPAQNKFVVHVKESTTDVTYDTPKSTDDTIKNINKHYPDGVTKNDLNQKITRTIVLKDSDGNTLKPSITQTVNAHRNATVNNVTGAIKYTDWTSNGKFDAVDVPQIDGYTADKVQVKNVDNPQVGNDYSTVVVYTRNTENAAITYVDDTTGNVLKSETATPKFGDEIKFTTNPADYIKQLEAKGYEVVTNGYQDGFKAKSDTTKNKFTVHVKHRLTNVKRSKDVHEHINYQVTDDSGKTYNEGSQHNPTLHFTQSGVKDEVTGKIDWIGKLNSQTFSSVNTVKRPGYVADITTIPSKTVTITNGDWNKNHDIDTTVNYKPEVEHVKLVVKDEQGNVVKTIEKSGKFGESYDFSNIKVPEINGYTFVKMSDNAKGKFGVENKDIVLTYKKNDSKSDVPVTPDKPEQPTKPDKPSKSDTKDTQNKNKDNVSNNTNRTNNNVNHENNSSNTNVNRGKQNITNTSSNTNSNVSSNNNTNNSSNSNSNANIDVFKQNIAKQQDDTLPEMAESTKDQALIGLGAVSLVGLIGVVGTQLKKRKN